MKKRPHDTKYKAVAGTSARLRACVLAHAGDVRVMEELSRRADAHRSARL